MKGFKAALSGCLLIASCGLVSADSLVCHLSDEKPIHLDFNLPVLNIKHQVEGGKIISITAQIKQPTFLVYNLFARTYQLNTKSLAYSRFQQGQPSVNGSCKLLAASTSVPAPVQPVIPAQPVKPAPKPSLPNAAYTCGAKRYCTQMITCDEAKFYLNQCGLDKLDKDGDGRPCENVCG